MLVLVYSTKYLPNPIDEETNIDVEYIFRWILVLLPFVNEIGGHDEGIERSTDTNSPANQHVNILMLIVIIQWILALQAAAIDFLIVAHGRFCLHQRRHTTADNVEFYLAHIVVTF